jgi:hypothetical protein
MKLDQNAFSLASAILAGAFWLVVMSFSLITGVGYRTVNTMGSFHPFFTYSWLGMITMVIEHLIIGYILGWFFVWFYNKLLTKKVD